MGSWREMGEEEREREREWKKPSEEEPGHFWVPHSLVWAPQPVSEQGPQAQKGEAPGGGSLVLAERPSHWPCQEVCRLIAGS